MTHGSFAHLWMLALLAGVFAVTGCGEEPTQIMVVVRTDYRLPPDANAEIDRVELRVAQRPDAAEAKRIPVPLTADTRWPLTLALSPASESDDVFVEATASLGDAPVAVARRWVRFTGEKKRMLVLDLTRACATVSCDDDATCVGAACAPLDDREGTLPPWSGDAPENLAPPNICSGPWGDVVEISVTENTDYDDDPSFTADLLEFYFASGRPGGVGREDIYVAKRETADSAWGAPELVPNVNSVEHEETPQISRDGLRLWFSREVAAGNKDLFLSTRPSRDGDWTTPVRVLFWDESEETSNERDVGEVGDGKTIFFSSTHDDGDGYQDYDVYVVSRSGDGTDPTAWATPVRLSQVSTNGASEMGPFPSLDGRRLYFHRQAGGGGDSDLYFAEQVGASGEFGAPVLIDELSDPDPSYDQDISVSNDECFAMFAREIDDPEKGLVSNVYVATRTE